MAKRNKKGQFVKGHHPSTEIKKGQKLALGYKWTEVQKMNNLNLYSKGNEPWNKDKKLPFYPHLKAIGRIPWNKGKEWPEMQGENHPNWNGGSSKFRRDSWEYKIWRQKVFKRDHGVCVKCGEKSNGKGNINADHIKPWATHPKLRFEVDNGQTLCVICHRSLGKSGRGVYKYG